MEPPRTPGGGSASQHDIFSVFETGFDDDDDDHREDEEDYDATGNNDNESDQRSPVLPDLLPSPEPPTFSPTRSWPGPSSLRLHSPTPHRGRDESPGVDSRDILVHRLNRLISQLDSDADVDDHNLDVLHGMIDRMENALTGDIQPHNQEIHAESSHGLRLHNSQNSASADNEQTTQSNLRFRSRQSHLAAEIRNQRIAQEANELNSNMEAIARSLQERQEETEHIQNMLLTRLEKAAGKIVSLQTRVIELENERDEAEMDILNLQIHIKSIEVQMPKNVDPELRDSISTWKQEWSALKRKRAYRRTSSHAQDSSTTPSKAPPGNVLSAPAPRRTMTSPG